jgi:hypothetical protein
VFKSKEVVFQGQLQSVKDLASRYGVAPTIVLARLRRGWDIEEALGIATRLPRRNEYPARVRKDLLDEPYIGPPGRAPGNRWKQ